MAEIPVRLIDPDRPILVQIGLLSFGPNLCAFATLATQSGGCRRGDRRPVRHSAGVRDGGGTRFAPQASRRRKSALREIFLYLAALPAFPRVSLALRAERNTFRRADEMRPLDTKPR